MYVFIGCKGRSVKRNISVVAVDLNSDSEAIVKAFEAFNDNEEVSFVEIWDSDEMCYVCGIDL